MAASFSATAIHCHRTPKLPPHFHRPYRLLCPTSLPLRLRPSLTTFTIHASSSTPEPRRTPSSSSNSSSSPLKPILVTVTAASALLLANLLKPVTPIVHASTSVPAAETQTLPSDEDPNKSSPLTDPEKEQILEEHLDSHPDDTRSLKALMEIKIKAEKFFDAVAIIDRLVILLPEDDDLRLLRAHLLCHAGDVEDARAAFNEELEKDPFLVEAYHGLVMAAGKFSDVEEGRQEMRSIVGRIEAAMDRCRKEKRKDDLRDFRLLVAQIRVMEGKFIDALGVYQQLVKEEPRDFRPYLCQGIIYSVLQKKDEAEKQFEKYRRLVPRGHPYAKYFDENVLAMKVFGQMEENKKEKALSR